ncbi:hypothetical protein OK349_13180 [Sphingomonas sp. BT-65]|uniref:hypothetical protein n=1 Tax=Sphingomonas sp. BT-65 TaxID=2989821 RepID=UPI002236437A|nr:hypothetical protein [Sphingomonas sp. BT-65]MCW4462664.1 hypothetical protein [Sphingomonas sp. BT-65]
MAFRHLFALLLLPSCSVAPTNELVTATDDGPPAALVANIERELADDPCLSEIATKRREYRYSSRDGKIDRNLVDIKVQEAGIDGLAAGRFILAPSTSGTFDNRSYLWLSRPTKSAALLWICGLAVKM